jgi:hypothetical protein
MGRSILLHAMRKVVQVFSKSFVFQRAPKELLGLTMKIRQLVQKVRKNIAVATG